MRRWLLTALVVAGALVVARTWPLRPDRFASEIAGAREITAYELVVGSPLTFALPPGARSVEVLSNLDLSGEENVAYGLRVRDPDDGRDELFPMVAQSAGAAAFFLGRRETPARTRRLSLGRSSARPGLLEIGLEAPGGTRASLRVLVAHDRLVGPPSPVVPRAGLALDDLDPAARAALDQVRWSRLATPRKSPTRAFYVRGDLEPPARPDRDGEDVGPGRVAAYTVRGPGTLHVLGPLAGRATLLDEQGGARSVALDLAAGERASLAVGAGLATLRLGAAAPAQARVLVSQAAMIVAPRPTADGGELSLGPCWSWQSLVRVKEPVVFAAGRRGDAAMRVVARVAAGEARLRWRFLDGAGALLAQGSAAVPAVPAPEDRLDGGPVSEPSALYLWPPRGAERLSFQADREVLLAVGSPGFDVAPPAIGAGVVLRHAPPAQPAFYPVRPLDEAALRAAGRLARFAGAQRLEPRPPAGTLAAPSSLVPRGDGGRFVLVAPLPGGTPARGTGLLWTVRSGHDETVAVPRPRGASRRAHVAATLLYETPRAAGRRTLIVSLDGRPVRRAALVGTRGQIALPALPVGQHRLRVDAPGRFFLDQPVAGAPAFRQSRVFALRRGQAMIAVPKGVAARSLGLVLYTDGPAGQASVEAVVDGGARRRLRAGSSRAYTRLRRSVPLVFRRSVGATYLNRSGSEIWASAPVFVPLGDDLPRGVHQIRIRTSGVGKQPVARFFSYGGPAVSRINQHVELRAEMSE